MWGQVKICQPVSIGRKQSNPKNLRIKKRPSNERNQLFSGGVGVQKKRSPQSTRYVCGVSSLRDHFLNKTLPLLI